MADLTITAASVLADSAAQVSVGTAGVALVAGNTCYLSTDGTWYLGLSSGNTTQAGAGGVGIALDNAAVGQPIALFRGGKINLGATLTIGQTYVVSAHGGMIAPISDLASTNWVSILGVAMDAANMQTPSYGPFVPGVQRA